MKSDKDLSKYLSPVSTWAMSFGCAVGWGAFVMPGTQFLPVAGPLGTTIGFFIGAVIMLIFGRNYHFMMQRYHGSGGTYKFVQETFGHDHGFLNAWFLILTYVSIIWANVTAIALIIRNVFGHLLHFGFHYKLAGYDIYFGEVLAEIVILVLCGLIVAYRKKASAVIMVILASIMIIGIIVLLVMVITGERRADSIRPLFLEDADKVKQIFNIVMLTPWAFIGFESVSHSSREFKFPVKKTFGILVFSVVCGYFSYTFLTDVAVLNHPSSFYGWFDYVSNLGEVSGRASLPVFNSVYMSAGKLGLTLLSIVVFAAILTGIIGNMVASSRLLFSMANNQIVPEWFKKKSKCDAPKNAVIFIVAVSAIIPFFGRAAIGWIVDVGSIGAVIAYGYTSASAFKCAKNESKKSAMVVGLIGLVLSVIFGVFIIMPNMLAAGSLATESYLILTIWSILGFFFFRYVFKKDEMRRFGRSTIVWVVMLFIIFFASMLWMRQETHTEVQQSMQEMNEYYRDIMIENDVPKAEFSGPEVNDAINTQVDDVSNVLTTAGVVQMILVVVGLIIMISVYVLIMNRTRTYEKEKLRAEENSRAKSVFLSNMSHDIRTPMNAIIGYINLSKREDITLEELKENMGKIEGSSQHLLALINDVLEMSRIESGKQELEEIETDLNKVMDSMRDMFSTQMSEKHIDYTVLTQNLKHPLVICDKNRLNRVLLNLISNAYKFTPEGGTVRVQLEEIETGYRLKVKDSGIGMSAEFAGKVFEAFERERTSTASGIQGTGLGMAITKSIVDLMGGTVAVDSHEGSGTEFTVVLPLKYVGQEAAAGSPEGSQPEASVAGTPNSEQPEQAGQSEDARAGTPDTQGKPKEIDFTGRKVLLVEDIDINREIATMILSQLGLEVDSATNGEAAVKSIEEAAPGTYDAVLMDIQMPVMDGYDATRAIRGLADKERAGVPIIAMTANAFSEDVQKARDAGMNAHVAKPIDIELLKQAMNDVMV